MSNVHSHSRNALGPKYPLTHPGNVQFGHFASGLSEQWTSFPQCSITVLGTATLKGGTVCNQNNHLVRRYPDLHHSCYPRCSTSLDLKYDKYHQSGEFEITIVKRNTRKLRRWGIPQIHIHVVRSFHSTEKASREQRIASSASWNCPIRIHRS